MANSANPEINKKIATSALGTLVIATVFFYLGDRYAETLVTYPGQIFNHLSDAFLSMWQTIKDAPFALDMTSNSLLFGGACFLIIWMIWLRYVAFIGNYRSGEESGSARWGTVKEGKKFKDLQTEDNNLLFTKNFGLALHRPKFDPEYDRNLNVLVVGGSGSGKTFNYVTPNICQLNTSYFVTDPKGTLLKDAGYLFTDNGYKLKSFNTINLDESMHYNPLKYVKTDTDILSFVNCFIMNTNPEGKSSGDPFWENAEKMLYTALIALLRDWFSAKDYNMSSLLTLLSLAEARENDENFKSALDLMFLQIEEGKKYKQNDGSSPDAAGNAGLSRSFGTKQADNGWSWVPSKFKRNSDGVKPADCGGLSADEDFALMNYKNFKVAAGKTLKSILISCNVRLAPIATDGVRELLTYDEMEIDTLGESYADGNLAVTAYLSDPTDESFGQPWSSVTVNFGSPLQQDATVFLDTNNMGEAMLSKISQLGAFTGQFMRSGFCSYPAFTFDTEVMGNMRDLNEFASADHSSLAEMRGACHAALENVYGSEFTDALESGYDLNAESHDCASGSAVLETCDTTRAEQPTNHVKGVR